MSIKKKRMAAVYLPDGNVLSKKTLKRSVQEIHAYLESIGVDVSVAPMLTALQLERINKEKSDRFMQIHKELNGEPGKKG